MGPNELPNVLIKAEEAGGLVLAKLVDFADSPELRELLRKIAHDEGYWVRELAAAVRRRGGWIPSSTTGDFAAKLRGSGSGWKVGVAEAPVPLAR